MLELSRIASPFAVLAIFALHGLLPPRKPRKENTNTNVRKALTSLLKKTINE